MGRKAAQGRKPNPTLAKARSQRQGSGNNGGETLKTGVTFSMDHSFEQEATVTSTFFPPFVALSNIPLKNNHHTTVSKSLPSTDYNSLDPIIPQSIVNQNNTREHFDQDILVSKTITEKPKEYGPMKQSTIRRNSTNSSDGDDNDCDSSDEENETNTKGHSNNNNNSSRNTKRFLAQLQMRQHIMSSTVMWRRSTSLLDTNQKSNPLNLTITSLLDSSVQVDEEKMTWRKEMLTNRFIEDDLMEGIRFLNKPESAFQNPLQEEIPFKQPETAGRRGLSRSGSDNSLNSTTSMSSVASVFSTISMSFLAFTRARSNRVESGDVASRRFIDFTPYCDINDDDDDDNGNIYEPPKAPETDDDDTFSVKSSYSIQLRNPKVEPSGRSKIARNFLDLTLDHSMREDNLTGHLNSVKTLLPITQEDDEPELDEIEPYTGDSNIYKEKEADDTIRALNVDNWNDDVSITSVDSDQIDVFTSDAWERADDAFIKDVHEVAHLLERNLMIKGCESPYWNFNEIVSQFDQIHLKLKENYDRCFLEEQECKTREAKGKLENTKHKNPLRQVTEQAGKVMLPAIKFSQQAGMVAIQPAVMITNQAGIAMKKIGQKLNYDHDVPSGQEHNPSDFVDAASETIGLDDFREGFRWRNERDFVRNFLYEKRHDYSVTLPSVLAKGLEKRLSEATTFVAVGIIDELTSPLHMHRDPHHHEVLSINPTEATFHSDLADHEHHRTPFYSTAVMALFGTSTLKSPEIHDTTTEGDVQPTSPSTDQLNCQSESAPIERLNLLERQPSHSSLMTTESTDNHAWLLAGSTPSHV